MDQMLGLKSLRGKCGTHGTICYGNPQEGITHSTFQMLYIIYVLYNVIEPPNISIHTRCGLTQNIDIRDRCIILQIIVTGIKIIIYYSKFILF